MARQPILLPDWIFGADGKRLVIDRVLRHGDGQAWTEPSISLATNKDRHGGLGRHLEALAQMGLMRRQAGQPARYELVPTDELDEPRRRIRDALEELMPQLDFLPSERVPPD